MYSGEEGLKAYMDSIGFDKLPIRPAVPLEKQNLAIGQLLDEFRALSEDDQKLFARIVGEITHKSNG